MGMMRAFFRSGVATAVAFVICSSSVSGAGPARPTAMVGGRLPTSPPMVVGFECAQFEGNANQTSEVQMILGGALVLRLCTNASTGYGWTTPLVGNGATLVLAEQTPYDATSS